MRITDCKSQIATLWNKLGWVFGLLVFWFERLMQQKRCQHFCCIRGRRLGFPLFYFAKLYPVKITGRNAMRKNYLRNVISLSCLAVIIALFLLCLGQDAIAKDKDIGGKAKSIKTTTKTSELQGEISAINKNIIAIVYQRSEAKGSEEEALFYLTPEIKFLHITDSSQLRAGDTVRIQFEEITEEYKEAGPQKQRTVKAIDFVKSATKSPYVFEPEPGDKE